MAILAIVAGLVAGTVVGLGGQGQSTRLDGDRDSIRKAANAFFLEAFPEVYPVDSGDGQVAGIHEIDFKRGLPQDPNRGFVPDFLVKLPDSAALVSWRIDENSGNVFFAQDGSPLIKPSNNRLDIEAKTGAVDTHDDHILALSMAKDEAAPEVIEIKIPAGYILGGGQADGGTVVGTLQAVLDTDNPFDSGKEIFFGGVIVATNDLIGNPNPDEWALVVDYNFNSSNVPIKESSEAVRKHTIHVVRPSGDSAGRLTINFARGSDGEANEATESWELTLFGTSSDKLTGELNIPIDESAGAGTAFTGFSVDPSGLTVPTPNNIPDVSLLKNPDEKRVYRWAAEEHSSIDPVVGDTLFFNDLPGSQGVLISGEASAPPIPPESPGEPLLDTTPPTVIAPSDIEVEAESEFGTPATNPAIAAFLDAALAFDDVDPEVDVTNDAPAVFGVGATLVTFTATDAANNTGTDSATVTITPPILPSPTLLAFTTEVEGAYTGLDFARQPVVVVRDILGERIITDNATQVTLSITSGTGTAGAVLSGSKTVTVINGEATFSGLNLDDAGIGYSLTATAIGPAGTTSSPFNVFGSADNVYWADSGTDKVQRADPDGSNVQGLVTTGLVSTAAVAVDSAGGKIYWADAAANKIERANLDGSSREDVVTIVDGVVVPSGITVDSAAGKIYWTQALSPIEPSSGSIRRANLDGSGVEDVVTAGLSAPLGIAVDPAGGKVYWVDNVARKVQRANLDGSGVEDLVTEPALPGLLLPQGIAVDPVGGKIYWTDRNGFKIRRANLDGTGVESIVNAFTPDRIAIDPAAGKIYWANAVGQKIHRANLDGSGVEDVTTGLDTPSGVALALSINP